MQTKIACIVTGKGGVGKTTISISIAGKAAESGKNVAVIDFDTNPSISHYFLQMCYSEAETVEECDAMISQISDAGYMTAKDLLFDVAEDKQLFTLPREFGEGGGKIFLIPGVGDVETSDSGDVINKQDATLNLRRSIYKLTQSHEIDLIIIDNGPQRCQRTWASMFVATDVSFVTVPEHAAIQGISSIYKEFAEVRSEREAIGEYINFGGIIINGFDKMKRPHIGQVKKLRENDMLKSILVEPFVTVRDAYKNASEAGLFPWEYLSTSSSAADEDITKIWNHLQEGFSDKTAIGLPLENIMQQRAAKKEFVV